MSGNTALSPDLRLGFIGGGKMAEAITDAIINKDVFPADRILISDPLEERRILLEQRYGPSVTACNEDVIKFADVIILAVKPQQIETVLTELASAFTSSKLIISIAAGVRINRLSNALPGSRIVRVMPNTPSLVGEMAAGYAAGPGVTDEEIQIVETILGAAGKAFKVDERLLDAVTGLSGSGPAFVAYLIEAFIQGGIRNGMPESIARELTLQTFLGTAKLLAEKKLSTADLISMVSSPGGTTIAGRKILENEPVRDIIERTIAAAAARSRELAGS